MINNKNTPPKHLPAILVRGSAQDIVGVARLLAAADANMTLQASITFEEEGIFAVPERFGDATGFLYGPEVEFHLGPAMNEGAVRFFAPSIIDRLNVLAAALDPNYQFLEGVTAYISPFGDYFSDSPVAIELAIPKVERKGSTLGRHPKQLESLEARQRLYWESDSARLVMDTLVELSLIHI